MLIYDILKFRRVIMIVLSATAANIVLYTLIYY